MRQRHTDILRQIAMLAITLVLAVAPMLAQAQTALAACHELAMVAPASLRSAFGPSGHPQEGHPPQGHQHDGHQHSDHQPSAGIPAAPATGGEDATALSLHGTSVASDQGQPASPEPGQARMIAGLACVLHCSVLADAQHAIGPATHVLARTAPADAIELASLDAEPAVPPPRR